MQPELKTQGATMPLGAFIHHPCLLSVFSCIDSKDILSRWTFPLVPDDNHPGGHSYEHLRGNKYIAKDNSVVLSRCCATPSFISD